MKSILILLILLIQSFLFHAKGREMKILSFNQDITKLNATKNPRLDYNGNNCAVIVAQIPLEEVYFEGNIIGEVTNNISEYEIYLAAGSKFMVISHDKFTPLEVDFSLFGIQELESKCTYILRISALEDAYNINTTYEEQYTGANNGHKYVDLGLSVLWSVTNLGANSPEGKGNLFAWGETESKNIFTKTNYKYIDIGKMDNDYYIVRGDYYIKYNASDELYQLMPQDDAANVSWGNQWRIPTAKEYIELLRECSIYCSYYNNVRGFIITGPNGHSIFLPSAKYWLSTLGFIVEGAEYTNIYIDATKQNMELHSEIRESGLSIRPVISKK